MLSVYNYADPLKYIQDFITHKRNTDKEFSLKKWSTEAGFSSPVPLVEILKGKKGLRPAVVTTIIDKIGLDKSEYPYFLTLVAQSRCSTELEENLYDLFMTELSPKTEEAFSVKRFADSDLFSHWIFTTILALAELKDFKMNAANIKKSLRQDVPIEIILAGLDYLLAQNLMVIDANDKAVLCQTQISTYNDKKHSNVKNYFSQMCDLSKNALDVNVEEREFQSFSLSLEKEKIPLAKEIVRKCRQNLTALNSKSGDEAYQMNMFFFPLTER